jgi:hypothetical protein
MLAGQMLGTKRKYFTANYPQFANASLKNVRLLCFGPKTFKEYRPELAQN